MASLPLVTIGKDTQLAECVVQLRKELEEFSKEEDLIDQSPLVFFRVPKVLLNSSQKSYIPSLVSMGPHHYGRADLSSMERHKSVAVFRVQKRIEMKFLDATIESFFESIVGMDNRVRKCYNEEIPYNCNALAWILTRDACFTFEFILNIKRARERKMEKMKKYDPVFNSSYVDPTSNNIASDLLLFENQIPLFILERLLEIETGSETAAEQKLKDMLDSISSHYVTAIFGWGVPSYEKGKTCHLLDAVYYNTVGLDLHLYSQRARAFEKSPFFSAVSACVRNGIDAIKAIILIVWGRIRGLCLRAFLSTTANVEDGTSRSTPALKQSSAVELARAGVKFQAVRWTEAGMGGAPLRWVRFDEETSTLYLPEVRLDEHSHTLMRNLMALELSSTKYSPRPITCFAVLMDKLIDSKEDVDVLTEARIIRNYFGSNEEVAQCFNALTKGIRAMYGCGVIDDAAKGLEKYTKRRYKILWSQFVSAYFSKPWSVAGSMAATLLLLMTVLQVFCLFYTCNR